MKRKDKLAAHASQGIMGARPSFVGELSHRDLERLRQIVRRVHMKHYPVEKLTDREADRIIESFGEETRQKLITKAVNSGFLA